MATTASTAPTSLEALYKGKRDHRRPLGELLTKMVREGRTVSKDQRTRWVENRAYYRGQQDITVNPSSQQVQRQIAAASPTRDAINTYNRLRQFTDGRVALLTKERPPYEVAPEDNDADSIDAARQAEKFLAARWGRSGWKIKARLPELAKNGDIDGLSFLSVTWDAYEGDFANQQIAIKADGSPVTSRNEYEALKAQDPGMQSLWRMEQSKRPLGDVCWRVVLPGAMSIDPFAIKSFDEARWCIESRVRPRTEVEKRLGKDFKDAVKESRDLSGERPGSVPYEDVLIDGDTGRTVINESDGVIVHYIYIKPSDDWPQGAHIELVDKAPNKPLLVEPWEDELPYFCYTPRPDPGHFLRSRGMVDDLKPIQRDFNTRLRYLGMWLKKVAMMPIGLPVGSMRSDSIYNEDGFYEFHAALGEPRHFQTPPEPTAILTQNLEWMTMQMREVSGVSSYAQGFTQPGGPESNLAISGQVQQTEQNLSEVEANFIDAIEWGCTRSLKLVRDKYDIPRAVVGVGVDDAEQFRAFTGSMLRGVGRMRINGPLMPKSKQIRMNSIAQFAPILGEKIVPYLAGLIDGDPTELQRDVEVDRQNEKGAIRELVGLVTNPTALKVYENFESDKQAFTEAMNAAIKSGNPDPMGAMAAKGIMPPNLIQSLQSAGVDLPVAEDFLNAPIALKTLDDFRKGDGYRKLHPMAQQLLRERAQSLKAIMGAQIAAMAQQQPQGTQQGSDPNPKGTPSPPKNTPSQQGGSA
jgi:hypothetical protein